MKYIYTHCSPFRRFRGDQPYFAIQRKKNLGTKIRKMRKTRKKKSGKIMGKKKGKRGKKKEKKEK